MVTWYYFKETHNPYKLEYLGYMGDYAKLKEKNQRLEDEFKKHNCTILVMIMLKGFQK